MRANKKTVGINKRSSKEGRFTVTFSMGTINSISNQKDNDYLKNVLKPLNDRSYYQVQNKIVTRKLYGTRRK